MTTYLRHVKASDEALLREAAAGMLATAAVATDPPDLRWTAVGEWLDALLLRVTTCSPGEYNAAMHVARTFLGDLSTAGPRV